MYSMNVFFGCLKVRTRSAFLLTRCRWRWRTSRARVPTTSSRLTGFGGAWISSRAFGGNCLSTVHIFLDPSGYVITSPLSQLIIWFDLLARTPADMIHSSPSTAADFAVDYDRHGDSYYDDTSVEALKGVFNKIPDDEVGWYCLHNSSVICFLSFKLFLHFGFCLLNCV